MKTLLRILVILAVAVAPSCLEIEEEISLNTDGSGTYAMTMDMNKMMEMMKGFGQGEDGDTPDAFGKMDSSMQEAAAKLREIDGVSNVKHSSENYRFTISYNFDDVETLNESSSQASFGGDDPMTGSLTGGGASSFKWTPKSFAKSNPDLSDLLSEDDEETQGVMQMAKMMMADAKYTTIYHFPGKVKKMTNDEAELSLDKKTVTLEVGLVDILEGEAEVGNQIKFKKK
ncbi:MAG: hypothetical protein AAF206_20450 [Bacteroidota bacterium]